MFRIHIPPVINLLNPNSKTQTLIFDKMQSTMATTSKYVKVSEWDTQANRYMQPRVSDRGLKTVTIINTQKNKKLHVQLPPMTCWGITDYTDQATGESDGKYSAKLHFSGKPGASETSKSALEKLRAFEEQVLQDAVANSEAWFGKKQSREIVEYGYFPFLKMGKNSETKQPDPEKGVYFRPKANCYGGKWDLEVFDTEGGLLFPNENEADVPMDYVPSGSEVTCGIECKQIWIGAKGWGISWAIKQCVVVPKLVENVSGTCLLDLSDTEKKSMHNAAIAAAKEAAVTAEAAVTETEEEKKTDTYAEDSDAEEEPVRPAEVVTEEPAPVAAAEEPEPAPKPVKKTVVKKAAPPAAPAVEDEAPPAAAAAPVKKKVVRKVAK